MKYLNQLFYADNSNDRQKNILGLKVDYIVFNKSLDHAIAQISCKNPGYIEYKKINGGWKFINPIYPIQSLKRNDPISD